MDNQFSRLELLYGKDAVEVLHQSRVCVFGVGGVGGFTVEAVARSGVGHIDIVDNDTVALSNLNRQIIATHDSLGRLKVDVMEERIHSIYPECDVTKHACFYLPETAAEFDFSNYDYVVDAVDTVTAKIDIIMRCKEQNVPVISAMGAGNKIHPQYLEVTDIYKTTMCPLAKVMRRELKKRGVKKCKVVYSTEKARTPIYEEGQEPKERKKAPGSCAFVPSVSGFMIAGEVINDLLGITE